MSNLFESVLEIFAHRQCHHPLHLLHSIHSVFLSILQHSYILGPVSLSEFEFISLSYWACLDCLCLVLYYMPVFCLFTLGRHGNFTAGVTMEQPDLLCTALALNIELLSIIVCAVLKTSYQNKRQHIGRDYYFFFFSFIIDKTGNSRSQFRNPIPVFNFRKFR